MEHWSSRKNCNKSIENILTHLLHSKITVHHITRASEQWASMLPGMFIESRITWSMPLPWSSEIGSRCTCSCLTLYQSPQQLPSIPNNPAAAIYTNHPSSCHLYQSCQQLQSIPIVSAAAIYHIANIIITIIAIVIRNNDHLNSLWKHFRCKRH